MAMFKFMYHPCLTYNTTGNCACYLYSTMQLDIIYASTVLTVSIYKERKCVLESNVKYYVTMIYVLGLAYKMFDRTVYYNNNAQ